MGDGSTISCVSNVLSPDAEDCVRAPATSSTAALVMFTSV